MALDATQGFKDHIKVKFLIDSHYMTRLILFLIDIGGNVLPRIKSLAAGLLHEKTLEKSFFEGEMPAIKINFRDIFKCALLSKIVLKKAFNYQPKLTCVIWGKDRLNMFYMSSFLPLFSKEE